MSRQKHGILRVTGRLSLAAWLLCIWSPAVQAQYLQQQVGGVSINADGILKKISVDEQGALRREREQALLAIPGDLSTRAELRKISLRELEAAITAARRDGGRLPDEIRYLAGLQRIRYVFVVPEQQDIILAGPAEGWRVNPDGEIVGLKNGQPVLLLDDLLVALRTAENARRGNGISCSIDPTKEGIAKLQGLVQQLQTIGDSNETKSAIEQTLGPQTITVSGIPATSHFARVLVAADYKMKRLAMGFDPTPIKGMPSFLSSIKAGPRGMGNMMPRWWLEPNYEGILASPDGMAFEMKGAGVKCVTEEEFVAADGTRQGTGKANPVAKKWADSMTAHYEELSGKESIFGQLRGCMDLAIVAALIDKEHLTEKAGYSMPKLLDATDLKIDQFHAPQHVDSIASLMQKGSNVVITVSGGVQVDSWNVVQKTVPSDKLTPVRAEAISAKKTWWWN